MIGAVEALMRCAHSSSCWIVFVSRSIMVSACSMCGDGVSFMGIVLSRNFERWLGPCAAAISVFSCGRRRCSSCAMANAEQSASGSALWWQSKTTSLAFVLSRSAVMSLICMRFPSGICQWHRVLFVWLLL